MNWWWERAACYASFDLRFFGSKQDQRDARLEFCVDCPVTTECVELRDRGRERYGTWGGQIGGLVTND